MTCPCRAALERIVAITKQDLRGREPFAKARKEIQALAQQALTACAPAPAGAVGEQTLAKRLHLLLHPGDCECESIVKVIVPLLTTALSAAVTQERERCARLVERSKVGQGLWRIHTAATLRGEADKG